MVVNRWRGNCERWISEERHVYPNFNACPRKLKRIKDIICNCLQFL